jgi:hypothetical protein
MDVAGIMCMREVSDWLLLCGIVNVVHGWPGVYLCTETYLCVANTV